MNGQANISILLADDHPGIRVAIRRLIERVPMLHVAGEAVDGAEAVRLARELEPDVVLMDVGMPGLSGIEATRLIVAATQSRVLMLSFQGGVHLVREALRGGAAGYLLKEEASHELIRAISHIMAGGRYLGRSVAGITDGFAAEPQATASAACVVVEAPGEEPDDGA